MEIAVIGVNHNIASIEIREKLSFTQSKKEEACNHLKDQGIQEVVILSTCNRSEIYIATEDMDQGIDVVKGFLKEYSGVKDIVDYLVIKRNQEAVYHLFKVTSGLESLVLGEDQILGQVIKAHEFAMDKSYSGKLFNKLFRESITRAKHIKNTYKISENPTSVSYTGLKLLKGQMGSLKGKKALVIGAGNMGKLSLSYLLEEDLQRVFITNRSHDRFNILKKDLKFGEDVTFVAYEDRYKVIEDVDLVISATASPHTILKKKYMPQFKKRLYILDLAIPRDVEAEIEDMENICLYDIDTLKKVIDENIKHRHHLIKPIMEVIDQGVEDFYRWKRVAPLDAIIAQKSLEHESIKESAMDYISRKTELSDKDRVHVEKMLNSSLKKTLKPIIQLKKIEDTKKLEEYITMLDDILGA